MRRKHLLTTALVLALALLGVPAATAAPVTCGMAVTVDIALTEDLSCGGDGLIVAADGVTIDLDGFSIIGSSSGTGIATAGYTTNVTGGTITGFDKAVAADSTHVTLDQMAVTGNNTGLELFLAEATVLDSSLTHNDLAVLVFYSPGIHVLGSDVSHNDVGISFLGNGSSLIERSTLNANRAAITASQAGGVTVARSTLSDNVRAIDVFQGGFWTISDNRILENDIGVLITDADNHRTVIAGNRITGNRVGVQFGYDDFGFFAGDDCAVTDNSFRSNGAAGLLIGAEIGLGDNFIVRGNSFIRNGMHPDGTVDILGDIVDDGIHIVGTARLLDDITLTSNTATRNGDYGIEADGVTDGGGNKARANTNPAQCLGVDC